MATKQTAWAVLLCRFMDTGRTSIPLTETNRLFTTAGAGTYNALRFFSDYSHGQLDLSGSRVFPQSPDYLTVDANINDYVPPSDPPPLNWQPKIGFGQLAQKAYDAAKKAGIPLDQFFGMVMVFNEAIGITRGGGSPVGPAVLADYRWVTSNGMTAFGQEMGHAYGLQHSRRDGQLVDYGDPWDVMSTALWPWTIDKDPDFGLHGPGLNAANMRAQGWLASNRVWRGSPGGFSEVVHLRPLYRRDLTGPLVAEFPPIGSGFLVEYCVKADWDSGIPRSAVLVHRFGSGHSYLMSGTMGAPDLVAGDTFDPYHDSPLLAKPRVDVLSIDDASYTATVRLSYTPVPALRPDWLGIFNTVIGQLTADASGLVWDGHRFVRVPGWNPMAQLLDPLATFVAAEDLSDPLLRDTVRRGTLESMKRVIAEALRDLDPTEVPDPLQPGPRVRHRSRTTRGTDRQDETRS